MGLNGGVNTALRPVQESFTHKVCLVQSRLSNFLAIRRLSPLPVTGLQI
jgi:hypothetical protein